MKDFNFTEKTAGLIKEASRAGATVGGALTPIFAPVGADKGKGWQSFGGAMAGSVGGGMLASATVSPAKLKAAATLLGMTGGALGAYLAHGPSKTK